MSRRSNNQRSGKKRKAVTRAPFGVIGATGNYLSTAGGTVSGTLAASVLLFLTGGFLRSGTGDPEGSITAAVGSIWLRTDVSATSSLYVKQTGTGNTGWVAK